MARSTGAVGADRLRRAGGASLARGDPPPAGRRADRRLARRARPTTPRSRSSRCRCSSRPASRARSTRRSRSSPTTSVAGERAAGRGHRALEGAAAASSPRRRRRPGRPRDPQRRLARGPRAGRGELLISSSARRRCAREAARAATRSQAAVPARRAPAAANARAGAGWRTVRRRAAPPAIGVTVLASADRSQMAIHEITLPLRHEDIIRQQARDKDLDPALIAAVIYAESKFRDQTSHGRRERA